MGDFHSCYNFILKKMASLLPPDCIGFVANPNIILPVYVQSEVVRVQDTQGVEWLIRRPRPLSVISGAQIVLQSDRELLARFVMLIGLFLF